MRFRDEWSKSDWKLLMSNTEADDCINYPPIILRFAEAIANDVEKSFKNPDALTHDTITHMMAQLNPTLAKPLTPYAIRMALRALRSYWVYGSKIDSELI